MVKSWIYRSICVCAMVLSVSAHAAQRELYKLPVGYSPISGATLPFFITVEERLFQKYGLGVMPSSLFLTCAIQRLPKHY
jgi:ABC-type nitrate/sulfonate/bicarbonate transport system substrate-binding protein